MSDRCDGCGLAIAGGTEACQAMFDEFRSRERSMALSYADTRLSVDVYCLQHPERYCVSAKSLAAHLTGVCWALELGGGEEGLRSLQRWLNGPGHLAKPQIPALRGNLTIADLVARIGQGGYREALGEWARSTWAAYSDLHSLARDWVDEAIR